MTEDINLIELLKNCPPETVLYSTLHGYVMLNLVSDNGIYQIYCTILDNGNIVSFTKEGKYRNTINGECVLFPSKENRDWNTFKIRN